MSGGWISCRAAGAQSPGCADEQVGRAIRLVNCHFSQKFEIRKHLAGP
jgi:hypothetical protein